MGYAELIQQKLSALPPEKQAEIYDFVSIVSARTAADMAHEDWTQLEFSRASLAQAMRGLEDDPVIYTRDDLKEKWQ